MPPLRRLRLARRLGQLGLWMSLVLLVTAWGGTLAVLAPLRAGLEMARTQLVELDSHLRDAQATLAPFDLLSRPETLSAVRTLGELTESAQQTPLINSVFGAENLSQAATLTAEWESALQDRPPLPALTQAREAVQGWQAKVQRTEQRLTWIALGFCVLFTMLSIWFAVGQWALYVRADERLRVLQRLPSKSVLEVETQETIRRN